MIVSILKLSRNDCKALNLKDVYSIHRTVYSLFPQVQDETRDFLFVDKGGDYNFRHILILSKRTPVIPDIGTIESKQVPAGFLQYDNYAFEVKLNPTKRNKKTGKTVAIRGSQNMLSWFVEKANKLGFKVTPESLAVSDIGTQSFKKDGSTCLHGKATFIGKLVITDRDLFKKTFENGIGRGKAFGFGLLQLIPLINNKIIEGELYEQRK